jgi:SAM-dependent methyltransferase
MHKVDYFSHNWKALEIANASFQRFSSNIRGTVLDIGCGTAPYRDEISHLGSAYIPVDWPNSRHQMSHVRVFADVAQALPFSDAVANTIVAFQVMEHLAEPEVFLKECYRLLAPGGRLILTLPFLWPVHEAPHDFFRYTSHGLSYLLNKHGFDVIEIVAETGAFLSLVFRFNYLTSELFHGWKSWPLVPVWYLGQKIAPWFDRIRPIPACTSIYSAIASKPVSCSSNARPTIGGHRISERQP